ncbi:uncharacterized protein DSM5745_11395 [Aspergillus mulundensis]|uniref:Uncharacterized protein n=1 Tax=Aspergillus mulundensis TaxID=1810919 RepID=A0A3D8Q889_9EURO|nr:hypothetical protein DSM5745_11395 [Aspergillus mulundensis]RDW57877.1 hypothetical protein DSM5745_11395 [Aspergillus mulundensis]
MSAVNESGYQGPTITNTASRHNKNKNKKQTPTAAPLQFHGGGMIMGSAAEQKLIPQTLVHLSRVPIFDVEYRLASSGYIHRGWNAGCLPYECVVYASKLAGAGVQTKFHFPCGLGCRME